MKYAKFVLVCVMTLIPHVCLAVSRLCPENTKCISTSGYFTAAECSKNCTSGSYCCPVCYTEANGETCPDGWTLTAGLPIIGGGTTDNTCTRTDNTIVAEDTKGYKKQNYGSCAPTSVEIHALWYEISSTDRTCNGLNYCMFCGN